MDRDQRCPPAIWPPYMQLCLLFPISVLHNVSNLDLRRVNVETRKHLQAGEAARAIGVKGAYEAVQSRSQLAPHAGRRYGGDAIRVKRRKCATLDPRSRVAHALQMSPSQESRQTAQSPHTTHRTQRPMRLDSSAKPSQVTGTAWRVLPQRLGGGTPVAACDQRGDPRRTNTTSM